MARLKTPRPTSSRTSPNGGDLRSELETLFGKTRAVTIDRRRQTVTFAHCHSRPEFWSVTAAPEVVCKLDEVLDVHSRTRRGRTTLTITTTRGTAYLSEGWSGFSEMRAALGEIARASEGAPVLRHPEVLYKWLPLAITAAVIWFVFWMGWV